MPPTAGLALAVGAMAECADDPDEARALHEESVAISRAVGDPRVLSWRLVDLSVHALGQGDLRVARRHAEECLAIAPEPLRAQGMICLAHAARLLPRDGLAKVQARCQRQVRPSQLGNRDYLYSSGVHRRCVHQ